MYSMHSIYSITQSGHYNYHNYNAVLGHYNYHNHNATLGYYHSCSVLRSPAARSAALCLRPRGPQNILVL